MKCKSFGCDKPARQRPPGHGALPVYCSVKCGADNRRELENIRSRTKYLSIPCAKCKLPECKNIPTRFKSGKPKIFCCRDHSRMFYNRQKYVNDKGTGVTWEESPGLIKAKLKIAVRDRKPWEHRCRTCDRPIEHEVNMIEDQGHHYCSGVCHTLRLTDLMMRHMRNRPPRYKEFLASIEPEGIST